MQLWSYQPIDVIKKWTRQYVEYCKDVWRVMDAAGEVARSCVVRNVPLLEAMLVSDGIICAIKFVQEYAIWKMSEHQIIDDDRKVKYKVGVVNKCYSMYRLSIMDRYLVYGVAYVQYFVMSAALHQGANLWNSVMGDDIKMNGVDALLYVCFCLLTLPMIQNWIVSHRHIRSYVESFVESKTMFMKYSISKLMINIIQKFDKEIVEVKNYHIFIIYKHLSLSYLYDFIKSYAFIHLLHFLRDKTSTYYYYKAIKLSYYYNCGYLFNVLARQDAIYIINIIIREKRWKDLTKVEVANAFYSLTSDAIKMTNDPSNMYLYVLKLFTMWSIVCLLKLLNTTVNTLILSTYLLSMWYNNTIGVSFLSRHSKRIVIAFIVYMMILMNTNDILISVSFFGYQVIYYAIGELFFFMRNKSDIKKVLEFYNGRRDRRGTR